jgi:subfamily B ATP-binding cassette protein MsbA
MSEFLGILILSIIIWFGGNMALKQPAEIEPGLFIMFISLFYFLINPLKALSQIFYNIHQGSASLERIQLILNADNQIVDRPYARALNSFEHQIEFKHVSFAYGDKVILKNIDLTIEKGKTLAIVGASGAGKSTLVDLIPRFHDTTSGDILIDGISIRDYRLSDVRALMGVVSQEPILFNDSIAENIALGSNNANESAIDAAAGIANARSFILEKEEGYATNIGDRGNKLSGGEKQRLTIARAIFKNPPVLILDEATSSLDTVSERQVQDAIQHLMENRTSIVIAHRLSTVQHADEIIVMEAGEIKERGTHQSLMQLGGLYKRLVEIQQEIK